MRAFRRSKFQRHIVIPLMLICLLSGCYKWSVQPAAVVSDEAPEQVRVMLSDGSVVKLRSPEVRGDSIVGWKKGTRDIASADTLAAYSLADVAAVEVRSTDVLKTTGLVVAGVFGIVAIISWRVNCSDRGEIFGC
jgi:hypothetical protein